MITVKHHDPIVSPHKAEAEVKLKKAQSHAMAVRLSVVGVLLLLAVAFFVYKSRQSAIARNVQLMAQRACQASIASSSDGIAGIADAVGEMDKQAQGLVAQARDIVFEVLGHGIGERVQAPLPAEAKPKSRSGLGAAASRAADRPTPRRVAEAPRDPDAPFGMPSKAELERWRAMNDRRQTPEAEDGTPPQPPAAAAPVVEPPPQKPAELGVEPPPPPREIAAAGRKVVDHADNVKTKAAELRALAEESRLVRREADKALTTGDLTMDEAKLRGTLAAAQGIQGAATQELALTQSSLQEVKDIQARYEGAKKEAQLKLEELRKEAERKALIQSELEQAAQAGESVKDMLKPMKYAEICEQLTAKMVSLQTMEGRKALQKQVNRYDYLRQLKAFLIEQINRKPFAWGWGRGASARDVIGADDLDIKLRNARAVWADVTPLQMRRFIEEYVTRDTAKLALGRQELAAAIYFKDVGEMDLASSYATKAVTHDPRLSNDADTLVRGD